MHGRPHRARKDTHAFVELDYALHGRERIPLIRLPDDADAKQLRAARVWAASVWSGHHYPDVPAPGQGPPSF